MYLAHHETESVKPRTLTSIMCCRRLKCARLPLFRRMAWGTTQTSTKAAPCMLALPCNRSGPSPLSPPSLPILMRLPVLYLKMGWGATKAALCMLAPPCNRSAPLPLPLSHSLSPPASPPSSTPPFLSPFPASWCDYLCCVCCLAFVGGPQASISQARKVGNTLNK